MICKYNSSSETTMAEATLLGSVVYVRYLDHVLYKNTPKPIEEATERETIGWLTKDEKGIICIENDRTLNKLPYSSGSSSGLVLLKRTPTAHKPQNRQARQSTKTRRTSTRHKHS